jgi:hypothetical protein
MTQQKQVIKYFKDNQNKPAHFKSIANELNILVPNMRRILGQGTLKGVFTRVSKGVYKLDNQDSLSMNTAIKLNDVISNDNGKLSINKNEFNILLNSVNDNEKTILKNLIK